MIYDETKNGEFRIFDKKKMRFLDQVWETDHFMLAHHINSFEKPDDPETIVFDAVSGSDYVNTFFLDVCHCLSDKSDKLSPIT